MEDGIDDDGVYLALEPSCDTCKKRAFFKSIVCFTNFFTLYT